MVRTAIYTILIFLFFQAVSAQRDQQIDSKYLTALLYLKTNNEVNQRIKKFHNQWLKKEKVKKKQCIDFNLSKYISYMPIPDFNNNVDFARFTESKSLNESNESHREKYYFELKEISEFKELVPNTDSKLYLLFSQPIDNYLIAEFIIKTSNHEIDMSTLKRGPALHLLILFDKEGLVEEIHTSGSYYN